MSQDRSGRNDNSLAILALSVLTLVGTIACSNHGEQARLAIEQHLKGQSVQDVKLDLFHAGEAPDRAYASVTITHNFANAEGKPQLEYLGYILKRDGDTWTVERSAGYTKEEQKARILLAGGK
jgi:hypothetical protein